MTTPKAHNDGKWTEGRFRGFITSSLRSAMRRWPPKWACLQAAYAGQRENKKTKRTAKHYLCASCSKLFPQKSVQVDHKIPIGHCETWDEFITKLFCEKDNLQVLCKPCHKKKTKKENS